MKRLPFSLASLCVGFETLLPRRKKLAEKLGLDAYELLEEQAKDVPVGSYGIIPTFSNVMNYISWRHAAPSFLNLSLDADKCGKKKCSVLLKKMRPSLHLET